HLAADDELLLVAAGQGQRQRVHTRRADVVRLDDALGVGLGRAPVDPEPAAGRRPGLVAEHAVLPERRLQQQALAVAVLGDVADAGLAAAQRGPGGDVLAVEAEAAARLADAHD